MSRIGNAPITIPAGVTVSVADTAVTVTGTKGELYENIMPGIAVTISEGTVKVSRSNDEKQTKASHGLVRSLIANDIIGVTEGFSKKLELVGTGYRAKKSGAGISLAVGYSHSINIDAPKGISFDLEGETVIIVSGINKQEVGQVAANIRAVRKPEPYKGKGIRYQNETIRRKAGKTSKS